MPARFINVSNSGRGFFSNVNNSGRALFGTGGPTTTTTTTAALVTVNFYAIQIAPTVSLDFHYSTDGGSTWNFAGVSIGTSCALAMTVNIIQNSSYAVRIGSSTNINTVYSSNRAANTTTCPSWDSGTSACSWPILTTANRNYAFAVNQEQTIAC